MRNIEKLLQHTHSKNIILKSYIFNFLVKIKYKYNKNKYK